MTVFSRRLAAPSFLFFSLLVGGSVQGVLANLVLQIVSAAILAAVWVFPTSPAKDRARALRWLTSALLVVIAVQLIPMPPALWQNLPGHAVVEQGYRLTGLRPPWLPISLAPEHTVEALLALLPAAAMLALMIRRPVERPGYLVAAVLLAALLSVGLGLAQGRWGGQWYLYPVTNTGAMVGLFANANHLAALLLVTIPLTVASAVQMFRLTADRSERWISIPLLATIAAILLFAIVLNGSFAIILLGGPVTVASLFLFAPPGRVRIGRLVLAVLLFVVAGGIALGTVAIEHLDPSSMTSVAIRQQIWDRTIGLVGAYFPLGSGLGTFADVYRLGEDPATVTSVFVNHAHNDYLEVALELGLAGMLLIAGFLWWWIRVAAAAWRSSDPNPYARAASIASLSLLLHSIVDFPLRAPALSVVFAMSIGLMVLTSVAGRREGDEPARHLTLEDLD